MKKLLILVLLLIAYNNIFAFLTQSSWRWRNDDGNETTATWKANENTSATLTTKGEVWRLRLELYTNMGTAVNVIDTLQFATSSTGPWTNITTTVGFNPFVIAGTSSYVVPDEPTSTQISPAPFTFVPGKIVVDSTLLENYSLPDQSRTEFEWAIKATAFVAPNTTYFFREWGATGVLDGGMTFASLTTAAVLPIKLSAFNASRENNKVKLEWTTASEQNNDRFEILRSSDGKSWKPIASMKGHGTTAISTNYKAYDESPLNGINYYIIKQYDVDGHSYQSDVKFVRMQSAKSIVSVYPNPAHSVINFSIANKTASNVEAVLTNVNGKIVHHETFANISANSTNKLSLQQQPVPGIYILKLNAEGLSESTRVVIE